MSSARNLYFGRVKGFGALDLLILGKASYRKGCAA
jgi:hypothetical protein